jgi:hypothetical protein
MIKYTKKILKIFCFIICFLITDMVFNNTSATQLKTLSEKDNYYINYKSPSSKVTTTVGKYWAILICGSNDFNAGFETDIRDWYNLLKNELDYNSDQIYYVAPSNWNNAIHYYSLSKDNIHQAIFDVAARSTENDSVFFIYDGHGAYDSYTGARTIAPGINPFELDSWLDTINPVWLYGLPSKCQQMIVVLQSCYAGGFISNLANHEAYPSGAMHRNRIVITSADKSTESWEDMLGNGDPNWDPNGADDDGNSSNPTNSNWDGSEFSSGLRMAFRDAENDGYIEADEKPYMNKPGKTPDITAPFGDKDKKVSIKETFDFAKFEDCYSVYWESYVTGHIPAWDVEYPQFWCAKNSGDANGVDPSKVFMFTHHPNKPTKPSGATEGKLKTTYTYTTSTTDSDGEQVYYLFDWGDGLSSGWLGPYNSGDTIQAAYRWVVDGHYQIKVKAKDIHDAESDWSDPLSVNMPKIKTIHSFLFRLL